MHKLLMALMNWRRTVFPTSIFLVCIFILITTMEAEGCSPKFQLSPLLNDSSCGAAFDAYLYALGQQANLTGKVFLDSTEQRNCLSRIKSFKDDTFGCGIENLTSGSGGCSDFMVADVRNKLGNEIRILDENCQFSNKWEQSCASCLKAWKTIGETDSRNSNIKTEADFCRIAVLVTLISSKIEDDIYVHTVLRCLGTQHIYIENQTIEGNQEVKGNRVAKRGIWILTGAATIGVILIAVMTACIMFHRYFRSASPKKEVTFGDMLKKTACLRIPIKEVYAATNHLNEMNIIGEGTAGKVYKGTMKNNQQVAVKQIINDDGNMETFIREVTSLSHVRHPNLVALLGCCVEGDGCFLVYELCPNGSLSEWLFGKNKVLPWIKRLEIAIDSAQGLWFLHSYSGGCIVHRDIKAKALTRNGSITEFADPKLQREYSEEAFDFTLQLALSCTALNQQRPSMEQVVKRLEEALLVSKRKKVFTKETPEDHSSNDP